MVFTDSSNPGLGLLAHSARVAAVSEAVAEMIGRSAREAMLVGAAALFHDVGKLHVPLKVLLKPSALDDDEWRAIVRHPEMGGYLLETIGGDFGRMAAGVARWHHEAFNGGGYPDGLAGMEIPMEAQLVGVCDAYDALRSRRAYKGERTHLDAVSVLTKGDDRLPVGRFNPLLVEVINDCGPRVSAAWDCASLKLLSRQMANPLSHVLGSEALDERHPIS
ncbi:MAG: HD domain-containing phosphohydrolase [Caulobacterales bacterium]